MPKGPSSERLETFEETSAQARHALWRLGSFGCLDELTTAANHRYGEMRVRQAIEGLSEFRIPFGWLRIGLDQTEEFERRRLMQETGVQPDQVGEIRGYADQRLRKPDDPSGASNRRVSIVVKYRGG
jgi:hypothetical protein